MNYLKRIEAYRDSCGIVASQHGSHENQGNGAQQHCQRPVQPDGPTERLLVDYKNQNQRKKKSEDPAGKICQQSQQSGFGQNQFTQLSTGSAEIAEQPKLAAAINHQRQERSGNS